MNSDRPRPSKKHYVEWLALKAVIAYIRGGTITATQKKIRRLTPLFQKILGSELRWAQQNIQLIYGDALSEQYRTALVKMVFENVLFSYVEGMQIEQFKFRDSGAEHLIDAAKLGRGVIISSIHIGSWEPAIKHVADLVAPTPTAFIYRHANNPLSEAEFVKIRDPYGVELIRRDQPRRILQTIRDKKVLGIMTDINIRDGGVTAPFLGVDAQCPPGPARLALRYKTPIVPIVSIRQAPGESHFMVFPALEPQQKQGVDDDNVAALTAKINATFAPIIHDHAEQYNWLHARWRTRHDGELWKPDLSTETMQAARVDPLSPYPTLSERVIEKIEERL